MSAPRAQAPRPEGEAMRARILEAIRDLTARQGRPPTYRELAAATGCASTGQLSYHVGVLRAQGALRALPPGASGASSRALMLAAPAPRATPAPPPPRPAPATAAQGTAARAPLPRTYGDALAAALADASAAAPPPPPARPWAALGPAERRWWLALVQQARALLTAAQEEATRG